MLAADPLPSPPAVAPAGPNRDAFGSAVRATDYLLSFRPIRYLLIASIQPLVLARYVYDRCSAPRQNVKNVVQRKDLPSTPPVQLAANRASSSGILDSRAMSPPRGELSGAVGAGLARKNIQVTLRPKFHRQQSSASDIGSDTSGSIYSTASTRGPSYLPKINKYAVLRTADSQFLTLAESFPWTPQYFKLGALRVHYIDCGGRPSVQNELAQKTVVLVHGALTWSYLFRKVIPLLLEAGLRVIALDLPGSGKSDKVPTTGPLLLQLQTAALRHLLALACTGSSGDVVGPRATDVTLVAHGTGSMVAACALADMGTENKVERMVFLNGFLPPHQEEATGREMEMLLLASSWFYIMRTHTKPSTHVRCISALSPSSTLTKAEALGYDLPYPTAMYAGAPRTLPLTPPLPLFSDPLILRLRELAPRLTSSSVPVLGPLLHNSMSVELETEKAKIFWSGYAERVVRRRAWTARHDLGHSPHRNGEGSTGNPVMVVVGEHDRVWQGAGVWLAELMGADLVRMPRAGHYSPEDDPVELARCLVQYIDT
ncbi:hypothetical protein HKX48_006760 [Thoreauomyces humboldtii]|nr:hypothetical protein HKX48_006760 [Thoreauomyces humboldtii]